jgi:lipoteichoic acid synthase
MSTLKKIGSKRLGFFAFTSILFWIKTYLSYLIEFELGVVGPMQQFILAINPIATTIVLFSAALYFKKSERSYRALFVIFFLASLLLYANILYYREFSDFLTMNMMLNSNSNVSSALFSSTFAMMRPWDLMYWIDFIALIVMVSWSKVPVEKDKRPLQKRYAVAMTVLGLAVFAGNLALAESDRPQLLIRAFDRNYMVKYLGINFFTGFDAYQTAQNNQIRASADESDLKEVMEFVDENYAAPNPEYFGIAEDRNVITIVLESAQQFMIDYELEDENGEMHELMPFVNSIYHDEATYSFENFFHQTGQGKSSDAEVLAENSLYGLQQGSAFQTIGGSNTFQAAPAILGEAGYTTAAFHGNVGSFWNRIDTYQNFGYDYFFDSDFYDMGEGRTLEYGLKDKLFFRDSTEYIEQLPQPFYSKFLTVTHHFPYPLDEQNIDFPSANTEDETINNFFVTAHYMDQAVEEFFQWLKDTGLYEDSIIIMYGDHYGISNMRNPHLAPLIGVEEDEWGAYHNAQVQRVPMMFHVPGVDNGEIFETYSGQVDILPTLLHLLGIETNEYMFMGQDMLSPERNESVPLRNGRVITPEYTFIGQNVFDTETGELLDDTFTEEEWAELEVIRDEARAELDYSDSILMMDLLRFYTPESLKDVEPNDYLYRDQLEQLQNHPNRGTSLIENLDADVESTIEWYETNAPELMDEEEEDEVEEEEVSQNSTREPRNITVLP